MCPHNDSSDIICRSKLKRNFIGSAKRGRRDGRRDGGTDGRTDGLILRSVDLHKTTTFFILITSVCCVHVRDPIEKIDLISSTDHMERGSIVKLHIVRDNRGYPGIDYT